MAELQNTPTPHIGAKQGEIAETILLPGDPLRAKYIAEHFLTDAKQFNTTRNMYGYTGYYQGKRVSVMGTGMGCPSMGIYSYELIHLFLWMQESDPDRNCRCAASGGKGARAYFCDGLLYDIQLCKTVPPAGGLFLRV